METTSIVIPPMVLEWSDWHPWEGFRRDARSDPNALRVPRKPGVYEARIADQEERLTIGKASDLRIRIKQGLVKGKSAHSSGKRSRTSEDTSQIVVRWAITDRPAAVEEELHKQYARRFGHLPRYTQVT